MAKEEQQAVKVKNLLYFNYYKYLASTFHVGFIRNYRF